MCIPLRTGTLQTVEMLFFSLSEFLLEWLVLAIFEGINGKTFEVVFPLYLMVVNCFGKENYRVSHAHTHTELSCVLFVVAALVFWRHIFCFHLPLASSFCMV